MRPLPATELEWMTVARLNAYRKKLLELEAASGPSDISDSETAVLDPELVYFKDDPRWAPLMATALQAIANSSAGQGNAS